MEDEEFYIGWQEEAPKSFGNARKKYFLISIMLMVLFSVVYLFLEKPFVQSYFDYGNLTDVSGQIVEYPVFGIKTEKDGKLITIPLVGFGKFDALPVLEALKERTDGKSFAELEVTLRGTAIYNNDKIWMELTQGDESIVSIIDKANYTQRKVINLGEETISGEIVDPKCFFGVMNPAYNKIHRSCAIRCISGGIPPVLAVKDSEGFSDYYFVTDENGKPLNQYILQYIGIPVALSGSVEKVDDWKVIKTNEQSLADGISLRYVADIKKCN